MFNKLPKNNTFPLRPNNTRNVAKDEKKLLIKPTSDNRLPKDNLFFEIIK